jgi:hypothetical protein
LDHKAISDPPVSKDPQVNREYRENGDLPVSRDRQDHQVSQE